MVPFTFPDCDEIVPSVFDGSVALQCFFVDLSHAHVIVFRMFGVSFWETSWATMIETSIELVDRLSLKFEPVNVDLTLSHLNATFSGVVSMSDAIFTTTLIQLMFHPMQPFGGNMRMCFAFAMPSPDGFGSNSEAFQTFLSEIQVAS